MLLSVDRVITGRAEKAALRRALVASGSAVDLAGQAVAAAVDMESSSWARTARRCGVPCLLVRGICDAAEDELPSLLGECLTPDGGIDRRRLAARVLREPHAWPAILRLRWRLRTAAGRVAELVETILRAVPEKSRGAGEMLFADPASATSGDR